MNLGNTTASPVNASEAGAGLGPFFLLYMVGESVIGLAVIIGNGLVLVAIVRETRLQTVTNYCVGSLAGADLLVGVFGIPCAMVAMNGHPTGFWGCLLVNTIIISLTQISIFGLLVIALERFIAIKMPFLYKERCSGKLAIAVIIAVWIVGILVGTLPVLGWNNMDTYRDFCAFAEVIAMDYMVYFNFFGCVLVPLVAMFGVYGYIYHIVKTQIKHIAGVHQVISVTSKAMVRQNKRARAKDSFRREIKAAKWFAVVIILFTVSWLPIHIMNIVTLYTGYTSYPAIIVAVLLSHANSAINPILYALSNTVFKRVFLRMLGCRLQQRHSETTKEARSNTNNTPNHYYN